MWDFSEIFIIDDSTPMTCTGASYELWNIITTHFKFRRAAKSKFKIVLNIDVSADEDELIAEPPGATCHFQDYDACGYSFGPRWRHHHKAQGSQTGKLSLAICM